MGDFSSPIEKGDFGEPGTVPAFKWNSRAMQKVPEDNQDPPENAQEVFLAI